MRSLEDAVLEIERVIRPVAQSPPRAMAQYLEDISEEAKYAIEARLAEIRAEIEAAKERYGLGGEPISQRRRLSARLSLIVVELAECTHRRMRSLGEMPSAERRALDTTIARLEGMVNGLNRLVRGDDD